MNCLEKKKASTTRIAAGYKCFKLELSESSIDPIVSLFQWKNAEKFGS
jgi:hypothetical protein